MDQEEREFREMFRKIIDRYEMPPEVAAELWRRVSAVMEKYYWRVPEAPTNLDTEEKK